MTILQTIKDYFAPAYSTKFADPAMDAKMLSALGKSSMYIKASNGHTYYYFFPEHADNLRVAKYLFNRNGVQIKAHTSGYYCGRDAALRILQKNVKANKRAEKFIGSINVANDSFENMEQRLALIKRQMQGYEK